MCGTVIYRITESIGQERLRYFVFVTGRHPHQPEPLLLLLLGDTETEI